jgi:hypothetical protein
MQIIETDTVVESTKLDIPELRQLIGRRVHVRITASDDVPSVADGPKRFQPGALKGKLVVSPAFDEPLEEMREYM